MEKYTSVNFEEKKSQCIHQKNTPWIHNPLPIGTSYKQQQPCVLCSKIQKSKYKIEMDITLINKQAQNKDQE